MEQLQDTTVGLAHADPTILNEESYGRLCRIFNSPDKEAWPIGQVILRSCKPRESVYWIWKISRGVHDDRSLNRRFKKTREFVRDSHYDQLSHMSIAKAFTFINSLGWMTPEIYQVMKEEVKKEVAKEFKKTLGWLGSSGDWEVSFQLTEKNRHLDHEDKSILVI